MDNKGPILAKYTSTDEGEVSYWFWCPGCAEGHRFIVEAPKEPRWSFNGDLQRPTVSPSLLIRGVNQCHLFIKEGKLQFLSDCTHRLANQTLEMPELPDWLRND